MKVNIPVMLGLRLGLADGRLTLRRQSTQREILRQGKSSMQIGGVYYTSKQGVPAHAVTNV